MFKFIFFSVFSFSLQNYFYLFLYSTILSSLTSYSSTFLYLLVSYPFYRFLLPPPSLSFAILLSFGDFLLPLLSFGVFLLSSGVSSIPHYPPLGSYPILLYPIVFHCILSCSNCIPLYPMVSHCILSCSIVSHLMNYSCFPSINLCHISFFCP